MLMLKPETIQEKNQNIQEHLTLAEMNAIGALVDLCRADWERRPAIIQAFLDATARRIVASDGTLGGQARLEGTRLSVTFVRDMIQSLGMEQVLEEYPQLIRADMEQLVCKTQKLEPPKAPETPRELKKQSPRPEEWRHISSGGTFLVYTIDSRDALPPGVEEEAIGFVIRDMGSLVLVERGDKILIPKANEHGRRLIRNNDWEHLVTTEVFVKKEQT